MVKRIIGSFAKDLYRSQLPDGLRATSTPLPQDYQLQSWDSALNDGHYDVYLSAPQNGLPAGIWFLDVQRHAADTKNNQYRVITARSFGLGNVADQIYQSTCTNGVWTPFIKTVMNKPLVWTTPTTTNSWVTYAGAASVWSVSYAKDDNGTVFIRGLVSGGSNTTDSIIFTLPVGYRIAYKNCVINCATNGGVGYVENHTNGHLVFKGLAMHTGNAAGWLSLATSFKAA